MKNPTRLMIFISILLIASISCQMLSDFLPSGGSGPDSFTAAATSPISVQLEWSSVEGAQKYLIERNDDQTDYFALGEISGETTSFEDFLVPSNTQVTYRIKTVTASGTSGGKTVTITTPEEQSNPLTVDATFDAQNSHSQAIGTEGGSVSVTDPNGVIYTLDIPAGALDNEVTFTLTPIQDIHGLPLSGGITSGVRIEPEGLTFNQSASLRIETAEAEVTDQLIDMAFAFDGDGREFHFVPSSAGESTSAVFKLANPANKSKMKWINVPQNKSYGSGKGTSNDIRDQVKNHPPSSSADNLNQKMAAAGDFKVQMVVDAILLYTGREVEIQVAGATDWLEFTIALDAFKSWLEERDAQKDTLKKDQLDKREEAIWEELVNDATVLLDKVAKDCKKSPPSPNLPHAKRLINQLLNGTSPFYKKFAEKMHKYSYQNTALKNIKAILDKCSPGWVVDETISGFGVEGQYTGFSCGSPYGPWEIKEEGTFPGGVSYGSVTIPFSEIGQATSTWEAHVRATEIASGSDTAGTSNAVIIPNSAGYQINFETFEMPGTCWGPDVETACKQFRIKGVVFNIIPASGECSQP